jgi:signal transduction histidine kinase
MANVLVAMRMPHNYLILVFDRDVLTNDMLPTLADRHFESDRYRVAVVDQTSKPLLTRGLPAGASIELAKADVTAPLFVVRPEITRDTKTVSWFTTTNGTALPRPARGEGGSVGAVAGVATGEMSMRIEQRSTAAPPMNIRVARNGWSVLVQHSAGSLDAAVTQARRRNLWLSFGILSVLLAAVGLIVFNARQSERLADQQMDFVATVSHELRTPVTVIRSAAQNLSAGVVQDVGQAKRYGDLIETEGRRLTEMVEQVLTYAGLSSNRTLRTQPIDPGLVVTDALDSCAGLLEAGLVERDLTIAPDLPAVMADEEALRRALQNLIGNAVKYGADGRWIGVDVSAHGHGSRREVQIAVSDRGRGIEAVDLPHVFEPFYRGRYAQERQIHGNGLGLSLVKRIAEAHGGRVTVKSSLGQGSTFVLHLPALAAGVEPAVLSEPSTSLGSGPSTPLRPGPSTSLRPGPLA